MKISVIVPVYNEEKYIGQCLESLVNQTRKPLEIIVVDDGSTDNSLRVVKNFQFQISNFKLLRQKHKGPAKARNLGAKAAKGGILVFADQDMRFDKKYLENLVKPIEQRKAVATFTKEEFLGNRENIWARCWNLQGFGQDKMHIDPKMLDKTTSFRAIKASTFRKTKGYLYVGFGEDLTVLPQLEILAVAAPGAICYHYNPYNIKDVFQSAKWIGAGETIKRNWHSLLVFSLPHSLTAGWSLARKYKISEFLVFKIIFDLGIFAGMLQRIFTKNYLK